MKIIRIFFLHVQHVLENRGRSFIWFLLPLINNLTLIVFFQGSISSAKSTHWNMDSIVSYYFIMTICGSLLMSHIEEDVGEFDILQGDLVRYLTRPFSYFWSKFIEELPYRMMQGGFGIVLFLGFIIFLKPNLSLNQNLLQIIFIPVIFALAFCISFTLKMILGLTTFWIKENGGLNELYVIINIVLSGAIVPLDLAPPLLKNLSLILPFSYTGYFPIIALQGKLNFSGIFQVIAIQSFWLMGLYILNRIVWQKGLKVFTAVGQ